MLGPSGRLDVEHVATPETTGVETQNAGPPAAKLTAPAVAGDPPAETVAVNVTAWPKPGEAGEAARARVVGEAVIVAATALDTDLPA